MTKKKEKTISPIDKFQAYFVYFSGFILALVSIVFIIWVLYPLLGASLFSSSFIFILILLFILAVFLFILFIGTLRRWKWVKIFDYILAFIAIALFVRYLVIGEINLYVIDWLITLVIAGIVLVIVLIKKLFFK